MIHNSIKITVMKEGQNRFMVGGHPASGTGLKGRSSSQMVPRQQILTLPWIPGPLFQGKEDRNHCVCAFMSHAAG